MSIHMVLCLEGAVFPRREIFRIARKKSGNPETDRRRRRCDGIRGSGTPSRSIKTVGEDAVRIGFVRADIGRRTYDTRKVRTALVERQILRIDARIDRHAAGQQGAGTRRPAVVDQRSKLRIDADDRVGG